MDHREYKIKHGGKGLLIDGAGNYLVSRDWFVITLKEKKKFITKKFVDSQGLTQVCSVK